MVDGEQPKINSVYFRELTVPLQKWEIKKVMRT
jgi:hypothetical protein